MQTAIVNTWGTVAALTFQGWDQCETTGSLSKIRLNTIFTGSSAEATADVGMEALRTPGNASATFWIPTSPNADRLRYLAVHEFGHILGFSHEQDSPDNWDPETNSPIDCDQTGAPSEDGVQISAYDADSIMNYCGNHGNASGTLSAADEKAIQQVYGPESATNITAMRSAAGTLHVFSKSTSAGELYWYTPASGWTSLGGGIEGIPAAVGTDGSRVDVFVKGTNAHIYQNSYISGSWSGFSDLGGNFAGDVVAVSWGAGRIDLFATDASTGAIMTKIFANGWWGGWNSLSGGLIGRVAAVTRGSNSIDLFVQGNDGVLYRNVYGGSSWTGWTSIAAGINGQPIVTTSSTGLEVVAIDASTGAVKHKRWTASNNTWTPSSGFNVLSGMGTEEPALVPLSNGDVRLYLRGTNLQLFGRTLTASTGSWSSWESLGGILLSSPRAEQNGVGVWGRGSNEAVHVWATYWNSIGGQVAW